MLKDLDKFVFADTTVDEGQVRELATGRSWMLRIPTHSSRAFRRIPAGHSDANQPVIPTEASHPFRGIPAAPE
ncbi:MAG: hypothetical protein ACJ8H8_03945 [Geminicoccaceae bacterium]